MEQFASGSKRHYYGKGDVTVYRLTRAGAAARANAPVFGVNVTILIYGEAFWPTYTTGDNQGLIATDSMKNFVQRETAGFEGESLARYGDYLAAKFLVKYPQVDGVQISALEIPYAPIGDGSGFAPHGPERAFARVEIGRQGVVDVVSALRGFRLLRTGGSAFHGFVRDEYTTLPDVFDRPLHMWLDVEWRYLEPVAALEDRRFVDRTRRIVHDVFGTFESGSIQQVIHTMGTRVLDEIPELSEVRLEANNRTWDTVGEQAEGVGTFTDPRQPYGCLGLRLTR